MKQVYTYIHISLIILIGFLLNTTERNHNIKYDKITYHNFEDSVSLINGIDYHIEGDQDSKEMARRKLNRRKDKALKFHYTSDFLIYSNWKHRVILDIKKDSFATHILKLDPVYSHRLDTIPIEYQKLELDKEEYEKDKLRGYFYCKVKLPTKFKQKQQFMIFSGPIHATIFK